MNRPRLVVALSAVPVLALAAWPAWTHSAATAAGRIGGRPAPTVVTRVYLVSVAEVYSDGSFALGAPSELTGAEARRLADLLEAAEGEPADPGGRPAAGPAEAEGHPGQCTATATSTGKRCRMRATAGGTKCRLHAASRP